MANIHNSKVPLGITWKDIYLFLCIFSYMTSAYGFIHFLSFIVDMSNGIRPNFSDMLIYMFMFGIGGQLGKFFWQRREIYASGTRGETMVVSSLSNMLPDRYSIYRNVSILSRYFKMAGCSAWIEGYVCFPSTKTISLVSSPMIGDTKYIASLIVNYVPKHYLSPRKIEAIKDSLEKCILEHPAMTKNEFEEHRAV